MKLIHKSNYKGSFKDYGADPVYLKCASGMAMSQCINSVQRFCLDKKRKDNKSVVVWDSNHHEIVLWFEDEKHRTYFLLSM